MQKDVCVILHNIRSAHNVGAILRTADGAGVSRVYCTGYTPSPIDRFGKINSAIAKTALGAEQTVLWQQRKSIGALVKKLHREGVVIVGVEQSAHAQPVAKFKQPRRTAYLFGNEVDGLSINEQAFCDAIIELPMMGKKESLNVSAAAAIVLYRSLI